MLQSPKQRAFLAAYANCGNVTRAAELSGVHRRSHYHWMKTDPAYEEAFQYAQDDAVDLQAAEARPEVYRDNYHHQHEHRHQATTVNSPEALIELMERRLDELRREKSGEAGQIRMIVQAGRLAATSEVALNPERTHIRHALVSGGRPK